MEVKIVNGFLIYSGTKVTFASALVRVKNLGEMTVTIRSFGLKIGTQKVLLSHTHGKHMPIQIKPKERESLRFGTQGFRPHRRRVFQGRTLVQGYLEDVESKKYWSTKHSVRSYKEI